MREGPAGAAAAAGVLAAAAIVALAPILGNDFIRSFDDPKYVLENPHVARGITLDGIAWAFTTFTASNWHPVTWLSHMTDCGLFGFDPRGHHATSLLLHAACAAVLFLALREMTGAGGRSALVAGLFAVHPLHVESVAWVAERKDVLCALFSVAAILAYGRYARAPGARRRLVVTALFALALLSKPMAVTLPFVFLLLDVWPLGRWDGRVSSAPGAWPILREKLPWIAMSAASGVVTLVAQRAGHAVRSLDEIPLGERLANVPVAYLDYLRRAIWPVDLAVLYPYPAAPIPAGRVLAATAILAVVTLLAVQLRKRRPYWLVGWLFYLGTLVPVIGIVQVGRQATADRYTYLPLVGIFVVAAWGLHDLLPKTRTIVRASGIAAVVVVALLAARSRVQAGYWKNAATLFERTVAVTEGNSLALVNLGLTYQRTGDLPRAIERYEAALRVDPGLVTAHANLGIALMQSGRLEEARERFLRGLTIDPGDADLQFGMGSVLAYEGRLAEARTSLEKAVRLRPDHAPSHSNLAAILFRQGEYAAAWREIERVRSLGEAPPPALVRMLGEAMPEPGGR